jgi:hypothetical protein
MVAENCAQYKAENAQVTAVNTNSSATAGPLAALALPIVLKYLLQ